MIDFLRQIWGFVHPYRARFFLGLLCGTAYALMNSLLVATLKIVLDLIFTGSTNLHTMLDKAPHWIQPVSQKFAALVPNIKAPAPDDTLGWVLVIGAIPAIMVVRNTFQYLSIYLTNWAAMQAVADVRTKLFAHLQNLSMGFFNTSSTGELIARITNDTQVLMGIIGTSLASAVKDPITIVCLMGYQLMANTTLTLISIVVFPVCIVPIVIFGRKVRKSARAVQQHNADLTNLMHESFTGSRVIKAYNLEGTVIAQFQETTRKYVGQMMKVVRANEIPSQLMEVFGAIGIALVFLYIRHTMRFLPKEQQPTLTDFTTFIMSIVLVYPPIKAFTRLHNQVHQAKAASERVFQYLATVNFVPEPVAPKMLHADKADIVFENVDFNYDNKKPVLKNFNLTVKAGQFVALVGETGSGKTTVANLLLRFYDPVNGAVKIGGVDLREVTTRDLRNQIALVTQDTILFNDTIRKNIELGRPGATDEEIVAAAQHASATDFIEGKPEKYNTVVGEKGAALSGGQKQRIAIARAIVKNAPILVLDEASSALDAETQRTVQKALDELMIGRTTICIAHRISTIRSADVIVVMKAGRIIEMGKHDELIKQGGVYQKLCEMDAA